MRKLLRADAMLEATMHLGCHESRVGHMQRQVHTQTDKGTDRQTDQLQLAGIKVEVTCSARIAMESCVMGWVSLGNEARVFLR